jgi:hypothetical protein
LSNAPIPAAKIHQTNFPPWTDGLKDVIGIVNASGLALQTSQTFLADGIEPLP